MDWDLDVVMASLPAVFFRGYADGSMDLFDDKVEALTGFTKEEFESRKVRWTDLILPDDREATRTAVLEALKSDNSYSREYRIEARAGNVVWVLERSQIVRAPDGRIEYISGLFFDVTERKSLQQALRDAEAELRLLIDDIPAVLFKGYLDGTIELFDTKVEAMTGYSREIFGRSGMRWTDLIHEADREAAQSAFVKALKTSRAYVREYRVRTANGRSVWIHERSHIVSDAAGRAESVSGLFFDITERKELEAMVAERTSELQQANERLLSWASELEQRNSEINLLGQMGDLLQSCDTSEEAYAGIQGFLGQLFPEDSGALFTFDQSARTVEAQAVWGESPPGERVFSLDECWALRRGRVHGRAQVESGFRCRHVGGTGAYLCVPMMAHGSGLGLLHVAVASEDPQQWDDRQGLGVRVAEHLALALAKLRLQETLQRLSVKDALTGLYNRRYLEETLTRELRRAERLGKQLGIIMLDIDHFKRFNDTLGHDAGDALLKELGMMLQQKVRGSDIACRYGGEEFTIVLQDVSLDVTERRAEQIRESAKRMLVRHGEGFLEAITLSLGVAMYPQHGATRELVMQAADIALYRAKEDGRDRVCVAESR